jgi:YesN/AraC family two-component response regulator
MKKSLCYNICGRFDEEREYAKIDYAESNLISKLLIFVSENYRTECTLLSAAQYVGYDYNYISKLFKKTVKLPFNSYVNNLRISEACRLLTNTKQSVQSVAESCGYTCTRTFHREFLKIMKTTPKNYREYKA